MAREKNLTVAYTPDSDDAFYYFGLEQGQVRLPGYRPTFHREHMRDLNAAALQESYDITAISSVLYPQIADQYAILSVGTSVGRGYGPVLVSRRELTLTDLRGARIGVPGIPTTGWFLIRRLCPQAELVEMPFDRIGMAVAEGALDAGVMIHEELLYYPRLGLRLVLDLGSAWCEEHGLPLPVGLNVVRRDLGEDLVQAICGAIRASLHFALLHRCEALDHVSRFGRGEEGCCTQQFVEMFANDDSYRMPQDVRAALPVLFAEVAEVCGSERHPPLDIVEGVVLNSVGIPEVA